jgi:hypothetical protein
MTKEIYMKQMNISEEVKNQYHIADGRTWTPYRMGDNIHAFDMVDFDKVEEFKGFLSDLGFGRFEIKGKTLYAHDGVRN